jgi:hypothetical protein
VRFDVHTTTGIKMAAFWDVDACSVVINYRRSKVRPECSPLNVDGLTMLRTSSANNRSHWLERLVALDSLEGSLLPASSGDEHFTLMMEAVSFYLVHLPDCTVLHANIQLRICIYFISPSCLYYNVNFYKLSNIMTVLTEELIAMTKFKG